MHPSHVELYLELSSNAKSDAINILSWSLGSVNTFYTCALVSRIVYDVETTVFWKGSDCLNGGNACSCLGTWTSIWTSCLRRKMKILSSCGVIVCPSRVISQISLDMMKILGTWSVICSLTMIDVCICHSCLET